ncbi:MAG: hypothetical protein NVS9B4_01290 [Candidatus Acidiferrum sp.]
MSERTIYGIQVPVELANQFDAFWRDQERCRECREYVMCGTHRNAIRPIMNEWATLQANPIRVKISWSNK